MAHLDAEVLAEFQAGLITGRRGRRITAHLAGCDRCTALGDQLAGVSVLLASVPMPAMPDHVFQRLDTVLAAEAAQPDHAKRLDDDRPAHSVTNHRRTPRPGFRLRSARVLAPVAVVLLGVAGYGLSTIGLGGSTASTAAGSSAGRSVAGPATGAAKSAPSIAASANTNGPVRNAAGTAPQAERLSPGSFTLVAGAVNFSADRAVRQRQVEQALSKAPHAGAAVPAASGVSPQGMAQLRDCVRNLAQGHQLILVESARFGGRPATLVVARTGPDDTAWIAGPACSATSRDVLATTTVTSGISGP